jgi:membrane protein CcdC involved in cytochrome C biogenesis
LIDGNPILVYENYYTMTTLVGIFFSFISVLGLLKGKSKKFIRKTVIIVFSFFLVVGQLMFMYNKLAIESQEFIAISGLVSGVILILAFQKNEAW